MVGKARLEDEYLSTSVGLKIITQYLKCHSIVSELTKAVNAPRTTEVNTDSGRMLSLYMWGMLCSKSVIIDLYIYPSE